MERTKRNATKSARNKDRKTSRNNKSAANSPFPANEAPPEPFVQPQANPVVVAMLNPSGSTPELAPSQIPSDLDLADDQAIQNFARVEYRKLIPEAKDTVASILRGTDPKTALAAAREINDQAGLTRKVDASDGNLSRVSALVLADAMLRLKQVMSNASVDLKDVTGTGLQPDLLPDNLNRQNAPRTK
jgi:hypothetical protein